MKRIKCPKCGKPVLKTIGVKVKGDSWYYIDKQKFGYIVFGYWHSILDRENRKNILGFYCRHCSKLFPESMTKEIFHWLKMKSILNKLIKT